MNTAREILQFLHFNPQSSREEIAKKIAFDGSEATLKRPFLCLFVDISDGLGGGRSKLKI